MKNIKNMNVVFIITSFWAYGELLIAKEFATDLKEKGNKILFIVPPSHKNSLGKSFQYVSLIPNSRNINRIIFNEVQEKFKPDIVVLSDFLNYSFADRHYGIIKEDLEIFKCKIATFDNFDWTQKRLCMDTYGYVSDIPKKVNIEDYGDRIIVCPLGNPLLEKKEGEYRCALFNFSSFRSEEEKSMLRKKNADLYPLDKKIILVSNAKWQEKYVQNENIDEFVEFSNLIYRRVLEKLSQDNIVISVGEKKENYSKQANIVMLDSMPAKEFDEYVKMSDLYIGKNITSTSMIRMALSGIPCVNIQNSLTKLDADKLEKLSAFLEVDKPEVGKMYKYRMFPVGWYDFLEPIMVDNPYAEIIQSCELFEVERTYDIIRHLLYDDEMKNELVSKADQLNSIISQLMSPTDIINAIIQK